MLRSYMESLGLQAEKCSSYRLGRYSQDISLERTPSTIYRLVRLVVIAYPSQRPQQAQRLPSTCQPVEY